MSDLQGISPLGRVTRIGRRLLIRSGDLLHWLDQKSALSLKEYKR